MFNYMKSNQTTAALDGISVRKFIYRIILHESDWIPSFVLS